MKTRLILAALLVGATVLVSGCGSGDLPAQSTLDAVNPQPAGAGEIVAPPQAEGDNSCDSEATLRPNAVQPRPGAMPPGSPMAAIVANGRLRVGVDQNTYLFGFRDPGTGQLQGFDIDIAREIAKDILGDPNKIELRSVTAAERISALHDKKVDLIVRTFSATCERRREVDFSAVYYRSAQRILAPRESGISTGADLAGKRVCVARGTTAAAPLFALAKRPTVIGVTNWTDCLVALQQGQVDAVSGDDPILFGLVEQDRNLQVVGEPIGTGAYAVGAPKGSDELVRFVNGVLERMRTDGAWQRIYTDKLALLGPSPGQPVARYVG